MSSHTESNSIKSKLVSNPQRNNFWLRNFGDIPDWIQIQSYIFYTLDTLCDDYQGGFWQFCELSNHGCFIYPDLTDDSLKLCNKNNGNEAEVSTEAAGIICCLLVFSLLSFKTESELMINHFYQLREFALTHTESTAIFHLID